MLPYVGGRVLVYAAGGGGDIVASAAYALKLRRSGFKTYLCCFPWERMVVDPVPGPISFREIRNVKEDRGNYVIIGRNSYAVRNGRIVRFQASRVAEALDEDVYLCDLNGGVSGIYKCLSEIVKRLNVGLVVALDVGGDIIAEGFEEELWSPLADSITLSALYKLESSLNIPTVVAVASIGGDGELSREEVLNRVAEIIKSGGYAGAIAFDSSDVSVFDRLLSYSFSEASGTILDALNGLVGYKAIRGGTRRVYIDPISTLVFHFATKVVYEKSSIAKLIVNTSSIEEANKLLLDRGVVTELELEKEIKTIMDEGYALSYDTILRARENLIKRYRLRA